MLGCIQPMSSPMMKRMLGFCCCCATAGALATTPTARNANRASPRSRRTFMSRPPSLHDDCSCRAAKSSAVRMDCDGPSHKGRIASEMLPIGWFPVCLHARNGSQKHGAGAGCKLGVSITAFMLPAQAPPKAYSATVRSYACATGYENSRFLLKIHWAVPHTAIRLTPG